MFRWIVSSTLLVFIQSAAVLPRNFPNDRIIGGESIDIAEIPYQVSLQDERPFCGGTLVSPVHVITAAHCTIAKSPNEISVRIGSNRTDAGGEYIAVYEIIEHPWYNDETKDYDISIVVLRTPQTWTLKFAILPGAADLIEDGDWAVVSGWGVTKDLQESRDILRAIDVPIINHDDCIELYKEMNNITDRMLCAGNVEQGGIDSCQGDSGGPLTINGVLIGVVSWGIGCGDPGYPGIYTMISAVRLWIMDIINL